MFLKVPEDGYWLNARGIGIVNEKYKSKYLGYFAMPGPGGWTEEPFDLFYVENPDRSQGHSNYFAIFYKRNFDMSRGPLLITNGEKCFEKYIDINSPANNSTGGKFGRKCIVSSIHRVLLYSKQGKA